jgi:MinD superfamily P-loop ATPase
MSKSKGKNKWMAHIKCFKCSNMGHCASICSNKVHKTTLPKKKTRRSKRKCYGCNGKGHEIASCSHKKDGLCQSLNKRQTGNKQIKNQDEKKKKTS